MTMPLSGLISLFDCNAEFGRIFNGSVSLTEEPVRVLAGKLSGPIGLWDLYGKTRILRYEYWSPGTNYIYVPTGVKKASVLMKAGSGGGGGGGKAGGGSGKDFGRRRGGSGGGGGGAGGEGQLLAQVIDVPPGSTLIITVGAGGVGGAGSTIQWNDGTWRTGYAGAAGGNGGDTLVQLPSGQSSYTTIETRYDGSNYIRYRQWAGDGSGLVLAGSDGVAYWDGVAVSLSAPYSQGAYVGSSGAWEYMWSPCGAMMVWVDYYDYYISKSVTVTPPNPVLVRAAGGQGGGGGGGGSFSDDAYSAGGYGGGGYPAGAPGNYNHYLNGKSGYESGYTVDLASITPDPGYHYPGEGGVGGSVGQTSNLITETRYDGGNYILHRWTTASDRTISAVWDGASVPLGSQYTQGALASSYSQGESYTDPITCWTYYYTAYYEKYYITSSYYKTVNAPSGVAHLGGTGGLGGYRTDGNGYDGFAGQGGWLVIELGNDQPIGSNGRSYVGAQSSIYPGPYKWVFYSPPVII